MKRRHFLDPKQLRSSLRRAAIEAIQDKNNRVLPRHKGGSSAYILSTQFPEDGGYNAVEFISIHTSQTQWLEFTRDSSDLNWKGLLSLADNIYVSTVDNPLDPKHANVHRFSVEDVIFRLDKRYAAIKTRGKLLRPGTPIAIALYHQEDDSDVRYVGAGIGIRYPPIAIVRLSKYMSLAAKKHRNAPLKIPKAREQLALSAGVPKSAVKISIDRGPYQKPKKRVPKQTADSKQAVALQKQKQQSEKSPLKRPNKN